MSSGTEAMGTAPSARTGALFTRHASGLVRELGVVSSAAISLAAVGPFVAMVVFYSGLTAFTKEDMYVPMLSAIAIWIVAMFAYRYLVQAIPRAGGEYVFLSRTVSPVVGSIAGLSIAVVFIYVLAVNGQFAANYAPFTLTALGAAFHSHSIANAANHVTSDGAKAGISVGIVVIASLLSLVSLKRVARLLLWLIVFQFVAFFVVLVLLADHSHSTFVNSFARYSAHPGAYAAMVAAGTKAGVAYGTSLNSMVGAIPFMLLGFNGCLYSYYLGGELRRPGRTYLYASLLALGLLGSMWVALWALDRHTVGLTFMQAQAGLAVSNPTAYAHITNLTASSGALGYALVLSGDPVSKILVGLGVPVTMIAINIAFIAVATRVLFAQAFDRLLPLSIAKVNERNHSPMVAIGIVTAGAIAFAILESFVTVTNIVALESLFLALIVFAGSIACVFLPITRPELVSVGRASGAAKWAGIPKITWVGLAATAVTAFVIVEVVIHPSVYGNFNAESVTTLAVVLLAGPVVYYVAKVLRRRKEGMDLGMAMRELPPE